MSQQYRVHTTRTETITYQLVAKNADDAAARHLLDGDEITSKTVCEQVDAVEPVSAD